VLSSVIFTSLDIERVVNDGMCTATSAWRKKFVFLVDDHLLLYNLFSCEFQFVELVNLLSTVFSNIWFVDVFPKADLVVKFLFEIYLIALP